MSRRVAWALFCLGCALHSASWLPAWLGRLGLWLLGWSSTYADDWGPPLADVTEDAPW